MERILLYTGVYSFMLSVGMFGFSCYCFLTRESAAEDAVRDYQLRVPRRQSAESDEQVWYRVSREREVAAIGGYDDATIRGHRYLILTVFFGLGGVCLLLWSKNLSLRKQLRRFKESRDLSDRIG